MSFLSEMVWRPESILKLWPIGDAVNIIPSTGVRSFRRCVSEHLALDKPSKCYLVIASSYLASALGPRRTRTIISAQHGCYLAVANQLHQALTISELLSTMLTSLRTWNTALSADLPKML